jgi:plasmid maintenance system killer protein
LKLNCCNRKVEKYFNDLKFMSRKCGQEITKRILKRLGELGEYSDASTLLSHGFGRPHLLKGNLSTCISIDITGNLRLILDTNLEKDSSFTENLKNLKKLTIKGVVDDHGGKYEWIIP